MDWAIFGAAASVFAYAVQRIVHYFRLAKRRAPKPNPLAGLDELVIRKLAELEAEIPTGDELSLAAVAWVKEKDSPRPSTLGQGAFQQLLAPGLANAYDQYYRSQAYQQQMLGMQQMARRTDDALARAAQQQQMSPADLNKLWHQQLNNSKPQNPGELDALREAFLRQLRGLH